MVEYQLFFGRSNVSDEAWAKFAAQVITPDLPSGFTELDAEGQWLNPGTSQISRERSRSGWRSDRARRTSTRNVA